MSALAISSIYAKISCLILADGCALFDRQGAVPHGFTVRVVTGLEAQQALRVDRPPPTLSFATPSSLPATQGQRCTDRKPENLQSLDPSDPMRKHNNIEQPDSNAIESQDDRDGLAVGNRYQLHPDSKRLLYCAASMQPFSNKRSAGGLPTALTRRSRKALLNRGKKSGVRRLGIM
jgi:hypothetical protein